MTRYLGAAIMQRSKKFLNERTNNSKHSTTNRETFLLAFCEKRKGTILSN